jgi:hypothetical protein
MKIESLEINLLKASEIKDGDIVIIKINEKEKEKLDKNKIKHLYEKITQILKKEIPIYFFPSNLSVEIIKKSIQVQDRTTKNENTNKS